MYTEINVLEKIRSETPLGTIYHTLQTIYHTLQTLPGVFSIHTVDSMRAEVSTEHRTGSSKYLHMQFDFDYRHCISVDKISSVEVIEVTVQSIKQRLE